MFQINTSKIALRTVPFIKIFDDGATSHWKASMANRTHCVGWLHAQSNVKDGLNYIANRYKDLSKRKTNPKLIETKQFKNK